MEEILKKIKNEPVYECPVCGVRWVYVDKNLGHIIMSNMYDGDSPLWKHESCGDRKCPKCFRREVEERKSEIIELVKKWV